MSIDSFKIGDFIEDVRTKKYYLPAIQRELVWGMDRIERLFDSLLCGYPVGTMLRWKVPSAHFGDFAFYDLIPNYDVQNPHNQRAALGAASECYGILDGQQRTTAMFIGLCGSYRYRVPRLWSSNPNAFQKAQLFIDLLYVPAESDDMRFRFEFRTSSHTNESDEFWFRVGDILQMRDPDRVRAFRRASPHASSDVVEDNLAALHTAVWVHERVHFYTEKRTDLDEVLRIFIRLNSGGIVLSYSDLLFSLVTASWKKHDAREEIHALVTALNSQQGASFSFDKDFVLRALLVCRGGDVRFRTLNFGRQQDLEAIWPAVAKALEQAIRLLVHMGFRRETLRAPNAVLGLAYYLYRLNDPKVIEGDRYAADREEMRRWLLRCFLGQVFRSGTDQLLSAIRAAIEQSWSSGERHFPAAAIDREISRIRGAGFNEDVMVQAVDETFYGSPDAFYILSLISPAPRGHVSAFDVDHLHPRSWAEKPELLASAGLDDTDIQFYCENVNRLSNLHLLTEAENRGQKKDRSLHEWLANEPSADWIRRASLLPSTVGTDVRQFRAFLEARRSLLLAALRHALNVPALSS